MESSSQDASPPLSVLILEDSAEDAELMEHALRKAGLLFTPTRTSTREAFLAALDKGAPDIILADYKLPGFTGLAALTIARERYPDTPVIIVTGTLPDDAAAELLHHGATDFVLKDRLARLAPAVLQALGHVTEVHRRQEAETNYATIFATAPDGIAVVDGASGMILDCNLEFERQAGRDPADLVSRPVWHLLPAEQWEFARARFFGHADNGVEEWKGMDLARPDGTILPVEARGSQVRIGGKRCLLVITRDITERRKADAGLRAQLDELRRFQRTAVDREIRLQELEAEIVRLKAASGTTDR